MPATPHGTDGAPRDIANNIERYLQNHTREGGHAWQMNMAARPSHWQPLDPKNIDESDTSQGPTTRPGDSIVH